MVPNLYLQNKVYSEEKFNFYPCLSTLFLLSPYRYFKNIYMAYLCEKEYIFSYILYIHFFPSFFSLEMTPKQNFP